MQKRKNAKKKESTREKRKIERKNDRKKGEKTRNFCLHFFVLTIPRFPFKVSVKVELCKEVLSVSLLVYIKTAFFHTQ